MELEHDYSRILLDLGLPLDAELEDVPLPCVGGLQEPDHSLLGVILSQRDLLP